MNTILKYIALVLLLFLASCTIDDQVDPNAPSINSVAENATVQQLNLLVNGIESSMRGGLETYVAASGSIAREMYKFDADPRNTSDLLGRDGTQLDNNTFYLTAVYNTRYSAIKTANTLLDALDNTSIISETEKNGYRGFAQTVQALMYSMVLDYLGSNGIRFDVADPENLGPFLSESEARSAIMNLLDDALSNLNSGSFVFNLTSGFSGFDTPSSFATFNRAVAARVASRGADYSTAMSMLQQSFYDPAGDFTVGPKHVYSLSSGDVQNSIFKPAGQSGDQLIVHNRFIENATNGDARLSKFRQRVTETSQDGLTGSHETAVYESNTSPIDMIRNEELIFIMAEARMQTGNMDGAVDLINVIRNNHGLVNYDGGTSLQELSDEWLYQKSYSFWGEGQHMFDLRRYNRLNDANLPIDRPGDLVHTQFPIPLTENQ